LVRIDRVHIISEIERTYLENRNKRFSQENEKVTGGIKKITVFKRISLSDGYYYF